MGNYLPSLCGCISTTNDYRHNKRSQHGLKEVGMIFRPRLIVFQTINQTVMETIELVSRLILAFVLFCALGTSVTIILFKMLFKPMTEEELREWNKVEVKEWKPIQRTFKSKRFNPGYMLQRKAY